MSIWRALNRQLAFAEEGYDLLEQKRQLLIFELMSRLRRAAEVENKLGDALKNAFSALREAALDIGSAELDRAALAVHWDRHLAILDQHFMGLRLPHVTTSTEAWHVQFGLSGTSANTDAAMRRFVELVPLLVEFAELQTALLRLARELRKTQRRCNALSKLFIPDYRDTIAYIVAALEERERESFIILRMIRDRLANQQA